MDKNDLIAIQAALTAHTALLSALALTHPAPAKLLAKFGKSMSVLVENAQDPQMAGALQMFEDEIRKLLALRGVRGR